MCRKLDVGPSITQWLDRTESRTVLFAAARSALAAVQLGVLLLNSDSVLFGSPQGPRAECTGIANASLWCVSGTSAFEHGLARTVAVVFLAAVVIGWRAAWTCIPHWYISVSMSLCITPIDGGSYATQAATLLLIPACLGDDRRWSWALPATALAPRWLGWRQGALFALRWQIAVVYVEAAISKAAHPGWWDGRALASVFADPQFGLPGFAASWLRPVCGSPGVLTVLGGAVIVVELLIALLIIGSRRMRRIGAGLAILLHARIIACMGLLPFGLTMCAVALLAVSDRCRSGDRDQHDVTQNPVLLVQPSEPQPV